MTTKLLRQIISPKLLLLLFFFLRSTTRADEACDVRIMSCSQTAAILEPLSISWISWFFPKPHKSIKSIKINKRTLRWSKNVKVTSRKLELLAKQRKIKYSEKKTTCQNVVAMARSNFMNRDLLYQIVSKLSGFSLHIKKVINGQTLCG